MNQARTRRSHSTISLDSLEDIYGNNSRQNKMKDNIENYTNKLVPLYDGDKTLSLVLQGKLSRKKSNISSSTSGSSILLSRNKSYLQQFREKMSILGDDSFSPKSVSDLAESICPEFGDTDVDSIGSVTSLSLDFFNTECYNEMLYASILEPLKTSDENVDMLPTADNKYVRSASENDLDTVKVRIVDSARQLKSCKESNLTCPYLDGDKIRNRIKVQEYSKKIGLENKMKFMKKSLSQSTETVISNHEPSKETEFKRHVNNKKKTFLPPIDCERKQKIKIVRKERVKSDYNDSDKTMKKSLKNIDDANMKIYRNCHAPMTYSQKVPNNLQSLRERHLVYQDIVGKMNLKL